MAAIITKKKRVFMHFSYDSAVFWFNVANFVLVAALVIGVLATLAIYLTGDIKEEFLKERLTDATREAGKANERAASLEKDAAVAKEETAKANARAEEARLEAAKANERILEMKKLRRLEKKQIDALTFLFNSPSFKTEPKPGITLSAVADAEARLFATELQNFFASCGVDVYPTDGGLVNSCDQIAPDKFGLRLSVKSLDAPCLAHVEFQRVMIEIGLPLDVQDDPTLREKHASLAVLMKPHNGDSVIDTFKIWGQV